jgi:hypothetical protein
MEQTNKQMELNDFLGNLISSAPARKPKATKTATSEITKATRIVSYKKTEKQPVYQIIVEILTGKSLTALEIAVTMYKLGYIPYPARAIVQPRVTELVEAGVIEAIGKKYDEETERNVAVYKVV